MCRYVSPTTPPQKPGTVWPHPRSLAATYGVSIDFLSFGYLDVSVPRVGSLAGDIPCGYRVSPFGHPWIIACLPAPQGFSQAPTSFIASYCQGIHRAPLVAIRQNRLSRSPCIHRNESTTNPRNYALGQSCVQYATPTQRLPPSICKISKELKCESNQKCESVGGGDRNRTDDPLRAKQMLSQLSYAPSNTSVTLASGRLTSNRRTWWARGDLNTRPRAYQARALTN